MCVHVCVCSGHMCVCACGWVRVGECVCGCELLLNVVTGWNGVLLANGAMAMHSRQCEGLSTGCHSMTSHGTHLECSLTEDLQTSQVVNSVYSGAWHRKTLWYVGSWNVWSLLDTEGPIETVWQGHLLAKDRRIDLVIREFNRFKIDVAILQETKGLGKHATM